MADTINPMRELTAEELNTASGGCCSLCDLTSCSTNTCPALYMTFASGGSGMPGMLQA